MFGKNMRIKLTVFLIFPAMLTLPYIETKADWKAITRSKCRTLAKQYVAVAKSGCNFPGYFCTQRQTGCGDVNASCHTTCFVGYGDASAFNGPSGGGGKDNSTGNGKGEMSASVVDTFSFSRVKLYSRVVFDDTSQNIILSLDSGYFSASKDSSFASLKIRAFFETDTTDTTTEDPGQTFWEGSLFIRHGRVSFYGDLPASGFSISTNADSVWVTASNLTINIPFPGPANLGVQLIGDTGFGAPNKVPTTTIWGLLLLTLLLAGTAMWLIYRKRRLSSVSALTIFSLVFVLAFYFTSTM